MAKVIDVAELILSMTGGITTMKLQKLVYYCQAQYLVMNQCPMFTDRIEAWPNGPVTPSLFAQHRGRFIINASNLPNFGRELDLTNAERASIEKVVSTLGRYTGEQLIKLTHSELPWRDARAGLAPEERSNREITQQAIYSFYSSPLCKNPVFS